MMDPTHYETLAKRYKQEALLKKCKAAVHLEYKVDKVFWESVFTQYLPGEKFHFIPYSKSRSGADTGGCEQCLAYRKHLAKDFVICIDSDYRYLLQERNIDIDHFIFQTYTYSFENHLCKKNGLSVVCESSCKLKNNLFDFVLFFKHYSKIVYELFIWHISLLKNKINDFPKDEFIKTIHITNIIPDIRRQGLNSLIRLDKQARSKLAELRTKFPTYPIEDEKIYFLSFGVHEYNTYLFIRGHNIFSLCVLIGKRVCDELFLDEKEKLRGDVEKITALHKRMTRFEKLLDQNIIYETYPEIIRIKNDIERYMSK